MDVLNLNYRDQAGSSDHEEMDCVIQIRIVRGDRVV